MLRHLLSLSVLLGSSFSTVSAQSVDPATALESWRHQHGASWSAAFDARSGFVQSLYGGHTEPGLRLRDDAAALARARTSVAAASALHGIDLATLVDERALFLPLSSAGTTDKYCASFRQVVRGVPVVGGGVSVLMDLRGRLLSLDSSAIPGAELARTAPLHEPQFARSQALRAFSEIAGTPGEIQGEPRLVLDRVAEADGLRAELAWEVDVFGPGDGEVPRGLRLRISDERLVTTSREELVHTCDVSGTVFTRLTPGVLPDIAANPTVQAPLAHVRVTSPQGNAITDGTGQFNIVGATAPLNVTVSYDGPFTTPTNAAAPVYSLMTNLAAPSGNSIVMNSPAQPVYTAEANSTTWIGNLRDYVRQVNPLDATADFDALSNINLAQTCNAFFNGSSVNFFSPGGGCVNTSYSTVVVHEMGHWLNVLYGSGNGPDGFGEGNADTWATFLTDQPIVGENFYTSGGIIRTALNTRQFCGDQSPGCYGGVHANGEVLMGALWKVRARLKTTLGASAGSATADLLFNSWMNAYNDTEIKTIIRTHWLVLDDDDGDLNTLTPHFNDIDLGFRDQGFPAYPVVFVSVSNVTLLGNTTNETGPYVVNATLRANLAPPLATALLSYRVNGGNLVDVPMTPLGGDAYTAAIPGQISPAKVEYCVRGTDALGRVGGSPSGAPATLNRFVVGDERVYFSDTFSNTFSIWAAGTAGGPNDWQFGLPMGLAGDPVAPRTGTKCWGTDLGGAPYDGLYSANANQWIESPVIDLSICPRPLLRFQRLLNVETALHDRARVLVNGQQVWQNPSTGDTQDLGWTEVEYDISAIAAGNPNVRIRFELVTDGQIQRGGWNIDDVEIVTVSAVGQGCTDPSVYCAGKLNSSGLIPSLTPFGPSSQSLGSFALELRLSAPQRPGILLRSATGPASTPFMGGLLCLQPPVVRQQTFLTDPFLYAYLPVPIDPGMIGQTWFLQAWFRDPPASFGVGLSNAVQATFCP